MKNKKLKKILIILAIILVILLIALLGLKKLKKKEEEIAPKGIVYTEEDLNILKKSVDNYYSDKVTPSGMSRLYGAYNGANDMNDLYRKLFLFVNYLPEVADVAYENNNQIVSFYNENKTDIKNNLGITEKEDFEKFLDYLKQQGYKGEKYENSDIQTDTITYNRGELTFDTIFEFENFENTLKLNVHFAYSNNVDVIVYYTLVEEDETEKNTEETSNTIVENTVGENEETTNTVN